MLRTATILCMAVGVIGMTATPALTMIVGSQSTDFSAQQKTKKAAPSNAPRVQQRNVNVNRSINRNVNIKVNRNVNVNRNVRRVGGPAAAQQKVLSNPVVSGPKGVSAAEIAARPRQGWPGRREARQLSVCEARQQGRAGLEEWPEKDLVGWRLEDLRSFRRAWCGGDRRRLLLPRRLSYGGATLLRGRDA